MTRPLRIQDSTPKSLREMSNTEIEYASYKLLEAFAANNSGVGTLAVNPGGAGSLTLIGTFTDTYRPHAIGEHPVGTTIISEVYDFYQDLTNDNSLIEAKPVKYTSGQGIKVQSNTDIETYIVSIAASKLVSDGLGSYKLQPTAPVVGGTWTSVATIIDKASGGNTTTYLWRRSTDTSPTTYRPLKQALMGNQYSLKEMSDVEIKGLVPYLRNYIVSSGIGQYRLQQNSPVGGTWVTTGSSFSDTREQLGNVSYTGNYTGNYLASFSGSYSSSYTSVFTGLYTGNYPGTYTGNYSRTFSGTYNRSFSGSYRKFYAGAPGTLYTGSYTGSFTGNYTSVYTGSYSGSYSGTYTGNYTGSFSSSFTGSYTNAGFSGSYVSTFTGFYTNIFSGSYTGSFTGTYNRSFSGSYRTFYAGAPGTLYTGSYTGSFTGNYSGTYTGSYTGTFSGFYSSTYIGSYGTGISFSGTYTGNYTGQTVLATKDTISTVSLWIRTA